MTNTTDRVYNPNNEVKEEAAPEQEAETTEESKETAQPQYEIPEKFKDKSVEDIAKSYAELEKQYGKQAQELGDVRKLAEQMIQRELKVSSENPDKDVTASEEEFEFDYDNPKESIRKLIENEIKPLKDSVSKTEGYLTVQQLQEKHPDFREVGSSQGFQEWVNSSSIRQDLYHQADRQGNIDAAMELLDTYKALNPSKEPEEPKEKQVKERVNEMTTETGTTGQSTGKTWSRRDIINLKAYNPKEYQRQMPEIKRAYLEGRVKA